MFICGGAFSGLDNVIRQRTEKGGIGFGAEVISKDDQKQKESLLHNIEPDDLVKYGLIPEFIGRLPVIATLDELDEDAMVRVLTEPKNAVTKQYAKLFELEDTELEFREEALHAIAQKAMKRKTGARGLRSILEDALLDIMYELPSMSDVSKVVIDDDVINGNSDPLLIFEGKEKAASD